MVKKIIETRMEDDAFGYQQNMCRRDSTGICLGCDDRRPSSPGRT